MTTEHSSHPEHDHSPVQNEHSPIQINIRRLWQFILGLGVMILVSFVLMAGYLALLGGGSDRINPADAGNDGAFTPPQTPLDPAQPRQRRAYEERQEALLSRYEWIDRQQNVARIPIERAMEMTVEKYGTPE